MFKWVKFIPLFLLFPMIVQADPAFDVEVRGGIPGAGDWELGIRAPDQNPPAEQAEYTWTSGQAVDWSLNFDDVTDTMTFNWGVGTLSPISLSTELGDPSIYPITVWSKLSSNTSQVSPTDSITFENFVLNHDGNTYFGTDQTITGADQFAFYSFPTSLPVTGNFSLTGTTTFTYPDGTLPQRSHIQFHISSKDLGLEVPEPSTYLMLGTILATAIVIQRARRRKRA